MKKVKLKNLEVKSFVTQPDENLKNIKAGVFSLWCFDTPILPCDDPTDPWPSEICESVHVFGPGCGPGAPR